MAKHLNKEELKQLAIWQEECGILRYKMNKLKAAAYQRNYRKGGPRERNPKRKRCEAFQHEDDEDFKLRHKEAILAPTPNQVAPLGFRHCQGYGLVPNSITDTMLEFCRTKNLYKLDEITCYMIREGYNITPPLSLSSTQLTAEQVQAEDKMEGLAEAAISCLEFA